MKITSPDEVPQKNSEFMIYGIYSMNLISMKIYSTPFEDSFCLFLSKLVETIKTFDPKEKPVQENSDKEKALNEYENLFTIFYHIGTINVKICLQVNSTTVCRKLEINST